MVREERNKIQANNLINSLCTDKGVQTDLKFMNKANWNEKYIK